MAKSKKKILKKPEGRRRDTERVKAPYKGREADLFTIWLSMPVLLRNMKKKELKKDGYDTSDADFNALLAIKTRTEFSKRFHVSMQQLNVWEKSDPIQKKVQQLNIENVLRYKKEVDISFTKKTMSEGDAARVKLWNQLFAGFTERSVLDIPQLQEITDKMRAIAEQR